MKYNIEKINLIVQKVAEVVKEAEEEEDQETVLNPPVTAFGFQRRFGIHLYAGDEITGLDFHVVAHAPFRTDPG